MEIKTNYSESELTKVVYDLVEKTQKADSEEFHSILFEMMKLLEIYDGTIKHEELFDMFSAVIDKAAYFMHGRGDAEWESQQREKN